MATMFIQQSEEYVRQIDAEIERLQQLRDQVQMILQTEESPEEAEAEAVEEEAEVEVEAPVRRATKKSPGKKAATKSPAKRTRTKATPAAAE